MSNPQVTIGVSAVDNAKAVLQSVDDKIRGTATNIDTQSTKIISRTSQMSASVKQNFGSIVTAAAGLGAGIVGFATSFSSIEKAQNAALSAQVTYEKSLQRLEKLQASGKATAEQLSIAQLEVANNSNKLKTAQDDVNERYMTFFANVPGQLISFGVAGSGIMKLLGISHGQAAAGATGQAGAVNLLSASLWRSVGAAIVARAAMIAAFIATPVGAAITAIIFVVSLFAFNVGGLRDRIFELGNAIMSFLREHFRPLHDAILWFIENVAKPLGAFFGSVMPENVQTAEGALDSFDNAVVDTGTGITGMVNTAEAAIPKISDLVDNATLRIQAMTAAFAAGRSVIDSSKIVHAGGSFRGAFGPGVPSDSGRRGVTGADVARHGGSLIDAIRSRSAQSGMNEFLNQDTVIFAHKGEHAQITPSGGGRQPVIIQLVTPDRRIFAEWLVNDISEALTRKRTIHMRITHEAIHGTM